MGRRGAGCPRVEGGSYDLYQPDREHHWARTFGEASPLRRPVFWTTDWGKRWPCQYPRSLRRIQEQLDLGHKVLTPRESLGPVDRDDWAQNRPGRGGRLATFFDWAKVLGANEWGDKCQCPTGGRGAGFVIPRTWAGSPPGGMPYVPWRRVLKKQRPLPSRSSTRRRPRLLGALLGLT